MRTETRGPTLISFFLTESQYLQTIAEQNLRSPENDEAEPHKTANSYHLLPTNTAASGGSAPRFKSSSIGGRNSSQCVRLLPAQLTPDLPPRTEVYHAAFHRFVQKAEARVFTERASCTLAAVLRHAHRRHKLDYLARSFGQYHPF